MHLSAEKSLAQECLPPYPFLNPSHGGIFLEFGYFSAIALQKKYHENLEFFATPKLKNQPFIAFLPRNFGKL